MTSFCYLQNNKNDIWACSEQTVTHTALWHSLKESLFCRECKSFLFQIRTSWHTKVIASFIQTCKIHKNAVNAMVTCTYNWQTNNVCISSMKLTYSSQDSLFHSESVHIGFKLTMPTVQELWPPQEGLHKLD